MAARWKKRLKQLWARRPRLGRGARTAINLAVIAVFLLYIWGLADYPLVFPTLELRRLERQYLLPKSEIVFSATPDLFYRSVDLELNGETANLGGTWRVGASKNWAAVMGYYMNFYNMKYFCYYPRGDGPDPVPMATGYLWAYRPGQSQGDLVVLLPLLFLDIPEGAVRAEVEMDIPDGETPCHRAGEGADQGNGVWLFGLEPPGEGGWSDRWYEGASYTLRAYAQDGGLLGLWTGTVPLSL